MIAIISKLSKSKFVRRLTKGEAAKHVAMPSEETKFAEQEESRMLRESADATHRYGLGYQSGSLRRSIELFRAFRVEQSDPRRAARGVEVETQRLPGKL